MNSLRFGRGTACRAVLFSLAVLAAWGGITALAARSTADMYGKGVLVNSNSAKPAAAADDYGKGSRRGGGGGGGGGCGRGRGCGCGN